MVKKQVTRFLAGLMGFAASLFRIPSPAWSLYPRRLRRLMLSTGQVRLEPMQGAQKMLMETLHFAKGIDPVADAFAGTVYSDVYSMKAYERLLFVVYIGVGATGSSTFKVNSCDNTTPSTRTEIPFWYREILTTDVQGPITRAVAATGFVNTVGSSKIILVEVAAADLVEGDEFVELDMVESVNNPCLGGVMAIGGYGRYKEDVSATILA